MSLLFIDTETTGLSPKDSAPFEIAFVFMSVTKKGTPYEIKRNFYLNALEEGIKYYSQAAKIHGVSEEIIKNYPPATAVVQEIKEFLQACVNGYEVCDKERPTLTGWNVSFDFSHLKSLLNRHNINIDDFITQKKIDVMRLVKQSKINKLRNVENYKLGTVANALGIKNIKEHSAAGDVDVTVEISKKIKKFGVKMNMITLKDIGEKFGVEEWYVKTAVQIFTPDLMKPFEEIDLDDERNYAKINFEDTKENWIEISAAIIQGLLADANIVTDKLKECLELLE